MNAFSPDTVERLGWILIHSLWQFAVLAIFAAVIVAILRRRSSATRYGVLVVAMSLMVVAPCATWMMIPQPAAYEISDLKFQIEHTDTIKTVPPLENSINEVTLVLPNTAIAPQISEEDDRTRRAAALPLADESLAASITELLRPRFSWIVGSWLTSIAHRVPTKTPPRSY